MSDQIEREQQIEEESLTKNSLQIQKAAWIREELEKRRAQEDQLLQQILREQQMLQELDEDMDQNMAHAKEGLPVWHNIHYHVYHETQSYSSYRCPIHVPGH